MSEFKNNLVLELHIPDFAKARDFYSMFGFKQIAYDPTSDGGSDLGYMVLKRQDAIGGTFLNFYGDSESVRQHAFFKDMPATTPRGYEVEITIPVSNVDELWLTVRAVLPRA